MGRKRMPAAQRREQLLDQALDIVAVEGFPALSIDRMAREAGLTRTAIYHQFDTLDGLVQALVERESHRALAGLTAIKVPDSTTGSDAFAHAFAAMLDAAAAAAPTWQVLLNPPDGGPAELPARIAQGRAIARGQVAALLRERVYPLTGTPDDPELTAHLLHALGEELTRLHLRDPQQYPKERLVRQAESFAYHLTPIKER